MCACVHVIHVYNVICVVCVDEVPSLFCRGSDILQPFTINQNPLTERKKKKKDRKKQPKAIKSLPDSNGKKPASDSAPDPHKPASTDSVDSTVKPVPSVSSVASSEKLEGASDLPTQKKKTLEPCENVPSTSSTETKSTDPQSPHESSLPASVGASESSSASSIKADSDQQKPSHGATPLTNGDENLTPEAAYRLQKDTRNAQAMLKQLHDTGVLTDIINPIDPDILKPENIMPTKILKTTKGKLEFSDEAKDPKSVEKVKKWQTKNGLFVETLTHDEAPSLFTSIAKSIIARDKPAKTKQKLMAEAVNMMNILLNDGDEHRFFHYLKILYKEGQWDDILYDLDEQLCKKVLGIGRNDVMEEARLTAKDYHKVISKQLKRFETDKAKREGPRRPPRILSPEVTIYI